MSKNHHNKRTRTKLVNVGRNPEKQEGFINPPIYKGSTVLFPDVKSLKAYKGPYTYGRHATPTSKALCDSLTELEHGSDSLLTESGLSAITLVLHTFAHKGAQFLVSDSVYAPTRQAIDNLFSKFGVNVQYFDPHIGGDIAQHITDQTTVIFCESPGSLSFEIHDLPAIGAAARKKGVPVAIDNTWATPIYHTPLLLGADISIHSGAKYLLGHSDGFFGSVTATDAYFDKIYQMRRLIGHCVSADEAHMGLRGLRTLAPRLDQHMTSGLALAEWFEGQSFVDKVIHPALPSHPDHDLWQRDFSGAGGLFSVIFKSDVNDKLDHCTDQLAHFGLGYSYGGFESLALPFNPKNVRTATQWQEGPAIRFYAGLEDVEDLLDDIKNAFKSLNG